MCTRRGFTLWCGVAYLLPAVSALAGQDDSRDRGKSTNQRAPIESRGMVHSQVMAPQRTSPPRATMPQKFASSPRNAIAPPQTRPQLFRSPTVASNPGRGLPPVPQYYPARPPQNPGSPTMSRAPLIRTPQPAASDMPRTNAPAGVSLPQPRDYRTPISSSGLVYRPSDDPTVHPRDDRLGGLIHIGADASRTSAEVWSIPR